MSILLAPWVGKLTDRVHPGCSVDFGFLAVMGSFLWLAAEMTPDSATWQILLPMALLGTGSAFVWAPTSATATRNLPPHRAGAGAGVYNATRQVGAVLGSAAIAVLIDSRLAANGLEFSPSEAGGSTGGGLPGAVLDPFSTAMAQSMLLPAGHPGVRGAGVAGLCPSAPHVRGRRRTGSAARPGRLTATARATIGSAADQRPHPVGAERHDQRRQPRAAVGVDEQPVEQPEERLLVGLDLVGRRVVEAQAPSASLGTP